MPNNNFFWNGSSEGLKTFYYEAPSRVALYLLRNKDKLSNKTEITKHINLTYSYTLQMLDKFEAFGFLRFPDTRSPFPLSSIRV